MKSGTKKAIITTLIIAAAAGAVVYFFKPDWTVLRSRFTGGRATSSGTPAPRGEDAGTAGNAKVLAVIDGDTIAVEVDGTREIVQAIGINAPEAGSPGGPIECYATESLLSAIGLLAGKTVDLKADIDYPADDGYGRLLRYIVLPDGRLYNKVMLEEGWAYEHQNFPQRVYRSEAEFVAAQAAAKAAGRGLWAGAACGGGA